MLKRALQSLLGQTGFRVFNLRKHYGSDGLYTLHKPRFLAHAGFHASYNRGVQSSNGVDPAFAWRVHVALWAAKQALQAKGDFVECGVNAGFMSSAIMHHLDWNAISRNYFLIDTFAGPNLEQYSSQEREKGRVAIAEKALAAGAYITDVNCVRRNFSEWRNASVVQGEVPGVLGALNLNEVAFLHLDMNCAYPECSALEHLWPKMAPGGVVLLDDYSYFGHELQGDALDALFSGFGADVLTLPTGQGLIIKR
ncbi:MAG: class I SAM-dependent methyltransferase [Acidobacteria bacterium]|nr:class I SAM-dependent methyltransferase [Acidobacteriota bacterium]